MPKTIGNISEMGLKQVPLPTGHSKQYAVVSHGYIIDNVKEELENKGYTINKEEYRCTHNGEVAQGVYHINHGNDPELGLMFAWCNSYDKSTRFKCAVGGYVFVCGNGVMIGDMANYHKKHYGDSTKVQTLVKDHIEQQISSANNYYNMIQKDKEAMKQVCLSQKEIAEFMGCLFFTEDIITLNQLSISKKEYDKPTYDYNVDSNSLWSVYNHVTCALKTSHPKNWMDQQAKLHKFTTDNYIPKQVQVDPNQMVISAMEETPNPLGEDDMNSCPQQEEWDQQTRIEEGFDHKGGLTVDELNEDELASQLYGVDNTGGLENAANEEADMIEKEEIIEEREEEDVLTEAEVIEEPSDEVSFDDYPGFEVNEVNEETDLSELNDIESELKNGSQEDFDEKVESDINVEEENSDEGKLELPDFEF